MPDEPRDAESRGRLVIVCGLPGAGKTTLAKRLAEQLRGVRLCPDEWLTALGTNLWDAAARERVESLQWSLAKDLFRAGTPVVVEWGTWTRAERDALRVAARALGASVELRYVDAPVDELWRRLQRRATEDPPITRAHLDEWRGLFEPPDGAELRDYDQPGA